MEGRGIAVLIMSINAPASCIYICWVRDGTCLGAGALESGALKADALAAGVLGASITGRILSSGDTYLITTSPPLLFLYFLNFRLFFVSGAAPLSSPASKDFAIDFSASCLLAPFVLLVVFFGSLLVFFCSLLNKQLAKLKPAWSFLCSCFLPWWWLLCLRGVSFHFSLSCFSGIGGKTSNAGRVHLQGQCSQAHFFLQHSTGLGVQHHSRLMTFPHDFSLNH